MDSYDRFAALLRKQMAGVLPLQDSQIRALHSHYELMLKWNRRLNLTRVVEVEEAVARHYAESLFLAARLPEWVESVADIGSGAGFPGYPVAVAKASLKVTLVESDQRKAAFLRECRDWAANVEVLAMRGESLQREFDAVISRAVKPGEVLSVASKVGQWVGLLVSEEDGNRLNWPGQQVETLPFGHGGVLWTCNVPRET